MKKFEANLSLWPYVLVASLGWALFLAIAALMYVPLIKIEAIRFPGSYLIYILVCVFVIYFVSEPFKKIGSYNLSTARLKDETTVEGFLFAKFKKLSENAETGLAMIFFVCGIFFLHYIWLSVLSYLFFAALSVWAEMLKLKKALNSEDTK